MQLAVNIISNNHVMQGGHILCICNVFLKSEIIFSSQSDVTNLNVTTTFVTLSLWTLGLSVTARDR